MDTSMERRSAIHPAAEPTVTVTGTGRELEILDHLQRFDVVPTSYIKAWVGNESASADRLVNLLHGQYVGILRDKGGVWCVTCKTKHPYNEDAWYYAKQKNVPYPLSIWPRGQALLAKRGLWVERERQSDQFDHKMFREIVSWSFAFGAKQNRFTYETLPDILLSAPWRPTKDDLNPTHIPVGGLSDLIPDSFVKIGGPSSFFAHIEIDNNTETQYSKGAENTIQGKVRRYAKYLEARGFNKRYGLPKITILFFFNKRGRVKTFLDVVRDTVKDPTVRQRFAAMYVDDFRESFPPPTGWALGTYERVGEPLNIMEIVNAKRESKEGGRTGKGDTRERSAA